MGHHLNSQHIKTQLYTPSHVSGPSLQASGGPFCLPVAEIYFYTSCDGCSTIHRTEDSLEWKEVKEHYSDSWGGTCIPICASRTVSVLWFQGQRHQHLKYKVSSFLLNFTFPCGQSHVCYKWSVIWLNEYINTNENMT